MASLADLLTAAGSGAYGSTGGVLVNAGVNLANLARAGYGAAGNATGLLSPSQMPSLIDPASVPGTSQNIQGLLGVGNSMPEQGASMLGGLLAGGGLLGGVKPAVSNLADNPVVSAVVRFGGREYDNPTHFQGINQALQDGTLVRDAAGKLQTGPTDSINLFRLQDGSLITRDQAGQMFGAKRTEDMGGL